MFKSDRFGTLSDGTPVDRVTLRNRAGMRASVLTYGAIVSELRVPDAEGNPADVVLGFDNLEAYEKSRDFFGAVAGRVAGRIPNGQMEIEGREFRLVTNDGNNHLHGGMTGLDRRVWEVVEVSEDRVRLAYHSLDGEEGYPGNLKIVVSYQLTDRNELIFTTRVESDQTTPVTLAQHSYFNLGGEGNGTIHDHRVKIFSREYAPVSPDLTPLCRKESTAGTPSDFNRGVLLSDVIPQIPGQHGDCYVVCRTRPGDVVPAARVIHPPSGRVMNVATTEECLQFYTGFGISSPYPGKSGAPYAPFAGLCLECQGYSAGFDLPGFQSILVRPEHPVRQQTVYAFSVA